MLLRYGPYSYSDRRTSVPCLEGSQQKPQQLHHFSRLESSAPELLFIRKEQIIASSYLSLASSNSTDYDFTHGCIVVSKDVYPEEAFAFRIAIQSCADHKTTIGRRNRNGRNTSFDEAVEEPRYVYHSS